MAGNKKISAIVMDMQSLLARLKKMNEIIKPIETRK